MNLAKLITIAEKSHYPFKRYPTKPCETVLFPGCAFPSQLPQTMNALASLCQAEQIGIAYDCCGHPLDGFDREGGTSRVIKGIRRRLRKLGCKMVVTVCPNCYALLKERLQPEFLVVSIFDLLDALDVEAQGEFTPGVLFTPCPDLRSHAMRDALRSAYDLSKVENLQRAGCCGLHPRIAKQGPKQTTACTNRVFDVANGRRIYTYCASCLGQFARMENSDCRHAVSVILGIDEAADHKHAFLNRALRAFDRNVNPCEPVKNEGSRKGHQPSSANPTFAEPTNPDEGA